MKDLVKQWKSILEDKTDFEDYDDISLHKEPTTPQELMREFKWMILDRKNQSKTERNSNYVKNVSNWIFDKIIVPMCEEATPGTDEFKFLWKICNEFEAISFWPSLDNSFEQDSGVTTINSKYAIRLFDFFIFFQKNPENWKKYENQYKKFRRKVLDRVSRRMLGELFIDNSSEHFSLCIAYYITNDFLVSLMEATSYPENTLGL